MKSSKAITNSLIFKRWRAQFVKDKHILFKYIFMNDDKYMFHIEKC